MSYNDTVTFQLPVTALSTTADAPDIHPSVYYHNSCILTSSPDGAEDLISPETELLISKLKAAVIIPLLFLFGAPTNILNMIVFFKQGLKDRVNLCLFSLALVDFCLVSFYFLLYVEHIFMFTSPETQTHVDTFLTNNKIMLFYNFFNGTKFLTAVIAVERCFCVLLPLRAKTLLKTKTMAIFILIAVPIICFLRLVVLAKYVIVCFFDERRQITVMGLYVTEYAVQNKEMLEVLDGIIYGFILSLGCPIVVLTATFITVCRLWQTAAWRQQTSSANTRKETAVTKMLVALSAMFLIYNLPLIWIRIGPLFYAEFSTRGRYRYFFLACASVAETGVYMDSSLSFIIYYSASSRYREVCSSLFKSKKSFNRGMDTRTVSRTTDTTVPHSFQKK